MSKTVDIYLSDEEIARLEEHDIFVLNAQPEASENAFGGINRALYWLAKCNCAILSGWRDSNTRKTNDENNRIICETLHRFGYGICKCRGCYAPKGQTVSVENSFFVFDAIRTGELFFKRIRDLSERFGQDCFLFKEAGGNTRAYLFGTNDEFGMGRRQLAGELHIGVLDSENHTRLGSGAISFV